MGQDLTKIEMDDRPEPTRKAAAAPKPAPAPKPDPRDANIFTADKKIQPPSPDEGPTKGKKKGGKICCKASGGKVGSASKRADGIAQRGKTRGTIC